MLNVGQPHTIKKILSILNNVFLKGYVNGEP